MTTDDRNSIGGTTDYVFQTSAWTSARITDFDLSYEEIAERNEYIRKNRLFLFSLLGAFVLLWSLLYWKVKKFRNLIISKVLYIKRLGFWSGFMSQARGLHWKR